jgi:hypothetical protein
MDTVIGLGQAGCNIADEFAKYDQYKILKIDCGLDGLKQDGIYEMPWQDSPERYEERCPDFNKFFKDVNGEVLFILGGSGNISGSTLSILEQLKHCDINVLYIRPDLNSISITKIRQEWVVFNILQEYARSGAFKRIYLVDNSKVEEHLGDVPVIGYYEKLNDMIVSSLHMINVYNHIEPVVDSFSEPLVGRRISTIGFYDTKNNENKLFYLLDNVADMRYYYAINKEKLETDGDILKKIREQIKSEIETSYGIFSTNYEQDYVYTLANTSEIQRQKK